MTGGRVVAVLASLITLSRSDNGPLFFVSLDGHSFYYHVVRIANQLLSRPYPNRHFTTFAGEERRALRWVRRNDRVR